jgi:hypothetical protein
MNLRCNNCVQGSKHVPPSGTSSPKTYQFLNFVNPPVLAQVLELSSRFLVVDNLGTKNLQRNLKGFSLDKSTQLRLFEKLEIKQILILKLATHVLLDLM